MLLHHYNNFFNSKSLWNCYTESCRRHNYFYRFKGSCNGSGNYFWLVYDINCSATLTNTVNGDGSSISVDNVPVTVTGTAAAANAIAAATSYTTVADGEWNSPTTWACGAIPPSNSTAVIIANNITVSNGGNIGGNVTVNAGSSLTVNAGGDLTLGPVGGGTRTLTVNGTLTINGGTLNQNGNVIIASASIFNQTGGDFNVDANDGTAGGSVGIGTDIFGIGTSGTNYASGTLNLTGGTITIVDPHFSGSTTGGAAFAFRAASSTNRNLGLGHTLRMGGSAGTNASTATAGFYLDTYINSSILQLGNLEINGGTGSRAVKSNVISGAGAFNVGGTLTINTGCVLTDQTAGTTLGKTIGGSIVNNGTLINTQATFFSVLPGNSTTGVASTVAQTLSGTGSYQNLAAAPTASFTTLTINNTNATGVTLNVPISVSGTLTMTDGIINAVSPNILTLGTGTTAGGTLTYASGKIVGSFKRWITAATGSRQFPMGTATALKNANINFTVAPTAGSLTARWSPTPPAPPSPLLTEPGVAGGANNVDAVASQGSWFLDAGDGLAGGTYDGTFTANGSTDVFDFANTVLIKRPSVVGSPWVLDGVHVTTAGPNTAPTLKRNGHEWFL